MQILVSVVRFRPSHQIHAVVPQGLRRFHLCWPRYCNAVARSSHFPRCTTLLSHAEAQANPTLLPSPASHAYAAPAPRKAPASALDRLAPAQPTLLHLRDGEVVLYRRASSPVWQCRYTLQDDCWYRTSTSKASVEHAVRAACTRYDEARLRQSLGTNSLASEQGRAREHLAGARAGVRAPMPGHDTVHDHRVYALCGKRGLGVAGAIEHAGRIK